MKKEKVERFCFSYEEVARVLATKLGLDESRRISLRDAGADTPALVLEVERQVEEFDLAELDCDHEWTPASVVDTESSPARDLLLARRDAADKATWVEGFMCARCGAVKVKEKDAEEDPT